MTRWNPEPAIDRALARVEVGDCWLWQGALDTAGYGSIKGDDGRTRSVHRLVYEALVGPVPEGLVLDHLCRARQCCNPDHLEPVTPGENYRRSLTGRCKYGHPLDKQYGRQRFCSVCARERWRRWKMKQTT
jgi:hypothetical protein